MDDSVATNYLVKRGGRYSIRRKIPLDLISRYQGKKEIVKALGTSDPAVARERVREESYRLDLEFAAARKSLPSGDAVAEYTDFPPEFYEAVQLYERDHGVKFDRPGDAPLEDVHLYWLSTRAQHLRQVAASEEALRRVLESVDTRPTIPASSLGYRARWRPLCGASCRPCREVGRGA